MPSLRSGALDRQVCSFLAKAALAYLPTALSEKDEIESSEKNRPCLTTMMTPPLACVTSWARMPDREWVRSQCRPEKPGIRKEEDELRLESWIQIRSTGWDERK